MAWPNSTNCKPSPHALLIWNVLARFGGPPTPGEQRRLVARPGRRPLRSLRRHRPTTGRPRQPPHGPVGPRAIAPPSSHPPTPADRPARRKLPAYADPTVRPSQPAVAQPATPTIRPQHRPARRKQPPTTTPERHRNPTTTPGPGTALNILRAGHGRRAGNSRRAGTGLIGRCRPPGGGA